MRFQRTDDKENYTIAERGYYTFAVRNNVSVVISVSGNVTY